VLDERNSNARPSSILTDFDSCAASTVAPVLRDVSALSSDIQLIHMTENTMPAKDPSSRAAEPVGHVQFKDDNVVRVEPQDFPTTFTDKSCSYKAPHVNLVSPNEKSPLLTTDDHLMTYSSLSTNPDRVMTAAMRDEEWQFSVVSEDVTPEPLQSTWPLEGSARQDGEVEVQHCLGSPGNNETNAVEWSSFPTAMEESMIADRLLVDEDGSDCRSSFTMEDHMSYKSRDADICSNSPDTDLVDLEQVVLVDVNRATEERLDNRPLPFYSDPAPTGEWTRTAADVENNQVFISDMSEFCSG
jgi:hypothetical protein